MRNTVQMRRFIAPLIAVTLVSALPAFAASSLNYYCNANVDAANAGTCAYLNSTIAPLYTSTFSNVNASIYVQYGATGLGSSQFRLSPISYSSYVAALTTVSQTSGNPVQTSAVSALNSVDSAAYGSLQVEMTSPLARALNVSGPFGFTSGGGTCFSPGSSTCFDGIITVTNSATLFFRSGQQPSGSYDFYSIVEHETDEVLGTKSCISTVGSLSTSCVGNPHIVGAVDLFRYQSSGTLALVDPTISSTPGAYFSYDGGVTNGANGKVYNTLANGNDYADFLSSTPCLTQASVQDAVGCPNDGGLDITNDGGAEINILNAIGYSVTAPAAPAPSIRSGGVGPVYSSATTIQSGEWISIYGSNLGPASPATWTGNFPTSLGGTSVTIDGKAAYLWYASASQLNVQVPDDATTGTVQVAVTTGGQTGTTTVKLAAVAPSFSLLDSSHVAGVILRPNHNGAFGGGTYDIVGPTGTSLGYSTVAAKAGDVVELFGVGFGPTTPTVHAGQAFSGAAATTNSVILSINDQVVFPTFAGLSSAGLYQVNFVVPAGLGTGDVPLGATVGGAATQNGVVLSLQ